MLLTLWPLRIAAYRLAMRGRTEEGRVAVDLQAGASAVSVLEAIERAGAQVRSLEFAEDGDRRRVDLVVSLGSGRTAAELIDALAQTEHVRGARWNP